MNAVDQLRSIFHNAGFDLPLVRVSCGFASSGFRSRHIGECWTRKSSGDNSNQIFISPSLDDQIIVLETLTHELCHAVDDCQHKHGREFRLIAKSVGLEGPMRSTNAGPGLLPILRTISKVLGKYPHSKLTREVIAGRTMSRPKAKCKKCGFEVTMIKRYLHFGAPICPKDKIKMEPIGEWN